MTTHGQFTAAGLMAAADQTVADALMTTFDDNDRRYTDRPGLKPKRSKQ